MGQQCRGLQKKKVPFPSDNDSSESALQYDMMRSWSLVMYMLFVLQSGCHRR